MGSEYQTRLPIPKACPRGYETKSEAEERKKNGEDPKESKKVYDAANPEICVPVEFEASWSTSYKLEFDEDEDDDSSSWDLGLDFEKIVLVILFTLIVVVIAVFLTYVFRQKRTRRMKEDRAETEGIIEHLEFVTKNQRHSSLAEEGEFDVAVHALLLDVLREIFRAEPELDRPSITAREIGAACREPNVSPDLDPLIQIVEWSRFAKRPATEENYLDLLPRSERLVAYYQARVRAREVQVER